MSTVRSGWTTWYAAKRPVLLFVMKFGLLICAFYGLLATDYCDRLLYGYLRANAWLSNIALNCMGQNTQAFEVTIRSPVFAMALRRGCDAVEPTLLLCSAMLAFRCPLRQKFVGMIVGALLFQMLNVLRIVSLFWIGMHCPDLFNQIHMEIWPTIFIVIGALIFISWKDWNSDGSRAPAAT
jgi:exosortase family protein XrtM